MKHVVKINPDGMIDMPSEAMGELGVIPGDELVWDLTEVLTNDLDKQSYTAATLSSLKDYEHEEKFRNKTGANDE